MLGHIKCGEGGMMQRLKDLWDLIELKKRPEELRKILSKYEWDYDGKKVQLTKQHILNVLKRCVEGDVSLSDLEKWANLIECREDIDYERKNREKIISIIFRIANPEINGELSMKLIRNIIMEF